VAVGYLGITLYYEQDGPVNALITRFGGPQIHWLSDPFWAKWAVILVDVWQWTPFVFLIALAGLQGLPQDLIEAARVDGASFWQVLRSITLPLMAPLLWLILLLRMIDAFKVFDIVSSLTLGGPGRATEVYTRYVYLTARRFQNYGDASAQSFLLLVIVMVLVSLLWGRIRHIYEVQR
jgi:multiple sugar transport system permease protein